MPITIKKDDSILINDVIATAQEKFPGYNKETALKCYYNLLSLLQMRVKDNIQLNAHFKLAGLLVNGLYNNLLRNN